jgi:hypothetical protein
MSTNDTASNRIDPDQAAYYLPAMPSDTLVALLGRIHDALDRYE